MKYQGLHCVCLIRVEENLQSAVSVPFCLPTPAIVSELPFSSVSKQGFVRNYLSENVFKKNKTCFQMPGFARGLVLKPRHKVTI